MNEKQIELLNCCRYVVKEHYYGKYDVISVKCFCTSLYEASMLIDALLLSNHGHCFSYKAEKISEDYNPVYDDVKVPVLFAEVRDYSEYLDWKSCLS